MLIRERPGISGNRRPEPNPGTDPGTDDASENIYAHKTNEIFICLQHVAETKEIRTSTPTESIKPMEY